jgi:hypothetical protein
MQNTIHNILRYFCICLIPVLGLSATACAQVDDSALERLFSGAKKIDLRTCSAPSVVKLREAVRIPAPITPVFVKEFPPDAIPPEIQWAFARPGTVGVTLNHRFIAVLRSDFKRECQDILNHELVHAYISLASPKELPFWFQEASAVHFSTDADRSVYARPSEKYSGITEAKVSELPADYQQKLQNFHFLIVRSGPDKFYQWYRQTIASGYVDVRPLLGLPPLHKTEPRPDENRMSLWIGISAVCIVVLVLAGGFYAIRRRDDFA